MNPQFRTFSKNIFVYNRWGNNTVLSGEVAEDPNVIHIWAAGASSERPKGVTSTPCYFSPLLFLQETNICTRADKYGEKINLL